MSDVQRTEAAYQRLAAEVGRLFGELVTAQETIADLRRQLAASQDQLQQKEGP